MSTPKTSDELAAYDHVDEAAAPTLNAAEKDRDLWKRDAAAWRTRAETAEKALAEEKAKAVDCLADLSDERKCHERLVEEISVLKAALELWAGDVTELQAKLAEAEKRLAAADAHIALFNIKTGWVRLDDPVIIELNHCLEDANLFCDCTRAQREDFIRVLNNYDARRKEAGL